MNEGLDLLGELPYWSVELDFDNQVSIAEVTNYIVEFRNAMQVIESGFKYEECSFSPDLEKGSLATLPNFLYFRQAEMLFTWKGQLHESNKEYSSAIKEYINILKLANTLNRDQLLISRLFQTSIQKAGIASLQKMLSSGVLSKDELLEAKKSLMSLYSNRNKFCAVLNTEYYFLLDHIARVISGEDGFLHAEPWYNPWIYDFGDDIEFVREWIDEVSKLDPCKYYEWPEHIKKREMEHDFQIYATMGFFTWLKWERYSSEAYPVKGFLKDHLKSELEWRGVLTLLAIRLYEAEHNRLPGKLADVKDLISDEIIIDPCSGKEFIYRIEGSNFYLYGVGKNGLDDKCKESRLGAPGYDSFNLDLDYIFHIPPGK